MPSISPFFFNPFSSFTIHPSHHFFFFNLYYTYFVHVLLLNCPTHWWLRSVDALVSHISPGFITWVPRVEVSLLDQQLIAEEEE